MSKPIYPDYKGNYKGKLLQPILKHSKVHRPKSKWIIKLLWDDLFSKGFSMVVFQGVQIQDISIGLENPLETACIYNCSCASSRLLPSYRYHLPSCYSLANFLPQHNKGDWNKDMEEQVPDNIFTQNKGVIDKYWPKPSLLTRVKERFKR